MKKTFYEDTLNYNVITKYLHSNKHKLFFDHIDKIGYKKNFPKKIKILDLGCGPAYIFNEISEKLVNFEYVGIEIRDDFINAANENFGHDERFSILKYDAVDYLKKIEQVDLIISFDCFEHMTLDTRNSSLDLISKINFKYMYVNVPNEIGPAILFKNFGSMLMRYVRHKEYTLMETFYSTFYKLDKFKPHSDRHKGFDWRVLYYSLRFFFNVELKTSPLKLTPRFISPSIFFICEKNNF